MMTHQTTLYMLDRGAREIRCRCGDITESPAVEFTFSVIGSRIIPLCDRFTLLTSRIPFDHR